MKSTKVVHVKAHGFSDHLKTLFDYGLLKEDSSP